MFWKKKLFKIGMLVLNEKAEKKGTKKIKKVNFFSGDSSV